MGPFKREGLDVIQRSALFMPGRRMESMEINEFQ